jgi:hypothetical protein
MVSIVDSEFNIQKAFEKGMVSIDYKSLEDLKKVAVKLKVPFIFKTKNIVGKEHYFFPHQGILYCYFKLKHHQS